MPIHKTHLKLKLCRHILVFVTIVIMVKNTVVEHKDLDLFFRCGMEYTSSAL